MIGYLSILQGEIVKFMDDVAIHIAPFDNMFNFFVLVSDVIIISSCLPLVSYERSSASEGKPLNITVTSSIGPS